MHKIMHVLKPIRNCYINKLKGSSLTKKPFFCTFIYIRYLCEQIGARLRSAAAFGLVSSVVGLDINNSINFFHVFCVFDC